MSGFLSLAAFLVSAALLAGMIFVLVLVRKGEGPRFSASRAYDANRREAVRVLTGAAVDRVTAEQWYDPARRRPAPHDPLAAPFRRVVGEALGVVVPDARGLAVDADGRVELAAEETRVLAALSTADLRALDLEREAEGARLLVGIVLFNPEPPGGDAKRVTLPVQAIFPALEAAGREDLVRRFERLRAGEVG